MTQPLIARGFRYTAKDRHMLLKDITDKNGIIALPADENGYPPEDIACALCGTNGHEG